MPRTARRLSLSLLSTVVMFVACQGRGPGKPSQPGAPGMPTDVATLAAFDPASVGPGAPPSPGPARPLEVADYGPQGRVDGKVELHLRFNQPVVALGLDEQGAVEGRFVIDPPLPGRASWRTPELLVFTLEHEPPRGHGYTVRFTGGVVGLDGQRFDRALAWSFETPRPVVVSSRPSSQPDDEVEEDAEEEGDSAGEVRRRDSVVLVEFDRPVALEQAQAHLRAAARPLAAGKGAAKPVAVRVRRATKTELERNNYYDDSEEGRRSIVVVQPRTLWPGGSEVEVSVTAGLRGEEGPLPLETPWSTVFRTYSPQALVEMSCGADQPCGLVPIALRLRNPVMERQLRKISVSPRPKFLEISSVDDWGEGGRALMIEGQFMPGTTYTVRVPAELHDIYGQGIAGGASRQAFIVPRASLALSRGEGILRPDIKQTVGVESRHVKALRVRLGVFNQAEWQALGPDANVLHLAFPARVVERSVPLTPSGKADWSSLELDLADLSGGALRPVLVEVAATELSDRASQYGPPTPVRGLFRLTDLGPIATASLPASSVQVLRLSTGAAAPGVKVSRLDPKAPGKLLELGVTDASGLLALPAELAPPRVTRRPSSEVRASESLRLHFVDPARDDHAHLDLLGAYHEPARRGAADAADPAGPSPLRPGERLIARVISERGVYRPGELVRVVGWSALDTPFSRSNLGRLKTGTPVVLELVDPLRKVVATHATRTSAEGKFWAELAVPVEGRLGRYQVRASLAGEVVEAALKVEDYRVPEFRVEARARRTDLLVGEDTAIDVHADYYFGGPVPISRVARSTSCRPQRFRPPGLEDIWTVGVVPPRWNRLDSGRIVEPAPAVPTPGYRELSAHGDASEARHAQRCTTSVAVQDASMQEVGAEAGFNVHPAAFYLAVAAPRGHLEAGQRVSVPLRAVSPQGQRVAAARVETLVTRHWSERSYRSEGGKQVFDRWVERSVKVTTCKQELPGVGADPACALPALEAGRYELAVSAGEPGSARIAATHASFQVAPRALPQGHSWRSEPITRLEVRASPPTVKPGDTLELAVLGPWPGAHGNLVLARGGVRETHPIVLDDREARFTFTVDDTWTPEVHFHASVVVPAGAGNYKRPKIERAKAVVHQGFEQRRLKVAVEAPATARPGERVTLRVQVRDEQDRPSAARVALWAVDEAVLALTQYEVPDLLPDFVVKRQAELQTSDDYARLIFPYSVQSEDPWFSTLGKLHGSGYGSGSGYAGGHGGGIRQGQASVQGAQPARSRFETTPVFLADLAVGRSGEAEVKARFPDNMSTFRVTALASARLVDGSSPGRFGSSDARTMVTAPLVLRAAMPRQLRPGDRAELAAIVQNNTGAAGTLGVTASLVEKPGTKNPALEITSAPRVTAALADGGQARLVFQVRALAPGVPELELQASLDPGGASPPIRDGLRLPLPVAAERTLTERVAAYGTLSDDQAVAIPIKIPRDVLRAHGGVTVSATSTLLGGLEDAVHALIDYPHGCVEQTSSRLLPLVALDQLGKDYPLGIADPAAFMAAGVERILSMQTAGGGFSYWPGGQHVHIYASAYATWVLQRAHAAGHPVPEAALKQALDHLDTRVRGLKLAQLADDWGYHDGVRVAIALHALADAGRDVREPAAELYALRQRLPLFARAFLLMALHRGGPQAPEVHALRAELLANVAELPATAHTSERGRYALDEFFASDGRSDAILLMALLRVEPGHAIVPKLARGLLERRRGGAWRNTQENAYALVALVEYARVYEAELPDFSARAWVGGVNVLDAQFKGRELKPRVAFTDMATILGAAPSSAGEALLPVVLQRQGAGRLYYRLGAEWAPAQADLPARAQGFTVTRALRSGASAITDSVRVGEPIAMDITVHTDIRVRYVVVDVPLPAGLEGVSRTLGQGRGAAVHSGHHGWWVSHEEQRPDRVVMFADDLPPGTHRHTIDLRSTSRGGFSFPPALAEAMYMPEVYGRTIGATLDVR